MINKASIQIQRLMRKIVCLLQICLSGAFLGLINLLKLSTEQPSWFIIFWHTFPFSMKNNSKGENFLVAPPCSLLKVEWGSLHFFPPHANLMPFHFFPPREIIESVSGLFEMEPSYFLLIWKETIPLPFSHPLSTAHVRKAFSCWIFVCCKVIKGNEYC